VELQILKSLAAPDESNRSFRYICDSQPLLFGIYGSKLRRAITQRRSTLKKRRDEHFSVFKSYCDRLGVTSSFTPDKTSCRSKEKKKQDKEDNNSEDDNNDSIDSFDCNYCSDSSDTATMTTPLKSPLLLKNGGASERKKNTLSFVLLV
jgi:hypothetical protein